MVADSGQVIIPGDPTQSPLLERITDDDEDLRMPPAEQGSALQPDQVAMIREWIQQGAIAPDEPVPPAPNQHWAFSTDRPSRATSDHFEIAIFQSYRSFGWRAKRAEKGLRTPGRSTSCDPDSSSLSRLDRVATDTANNLTISGPGRESSMNCLRVLIMASDGRGTGWTFGGTRIGMASGRNFASAKSTCGTGAIGSLIP